MYGRPMVRWCCLVAVVAFACSSSERRFSSSEQNGGAGGLAGLNGESGRATGGSGGVTAGSGPVGSEAGEAGADAAAGAAGTDGGGGAAGSDTGDGDAGMAGSNDVATCADCRIGAVCVGKGSRNPANPCEICDVSRARDSYSPNTGANCGSGASECSAQDTCDERAVCQTNDVVSGTHCTGGACQAGVCKTSPFDCIAPTPPLAGLPSQVYGATGTPAAASGGTIADGRYTPKRVDLYNQSAVGIDVRTFEFKAGFVQAALRYFNVSNGVAYIPEVQFAGTFSASASSLKFDLERCDPNYDLSIPNLSYTATANGMVTYETLNDGTIVVTSYLRE